MMFLSDTANDNSLTKIALGGVLAAAGYLAKLIIDWWREWQDRKAERRARLLKLESMLRASRVAFSIQAKHRDNLAGRLRGKQTAGAESEGYESLFSACYQGFSPEEAELHRVIRGITMHALLPINQAISVWLEQDIWFRANQGARKGSLELAGKLNDLAAHLMLWIAKYEIWIPDQPQHALVYMADEKAHGLGFPDGLDQAVLNELNRRNNGHQV